MRSREARSQRRQNSADPAVLVQPGSGECLVQLGDCRRWSQPRLGVIRPTEKGGGGTGLGEGVTAVDEDGGGPEELEAIGVFDGKGRDTPSFTRRAVPPTPSTTTAHSFCRLTPRR